MVEQEPRAADEQSGPRGLAERYDVVVVGGGAAGLAGALALARSRRSVLVVDAGAPRNAPAAGVHNHLGSEGARPQELYATARADVEAVGGVVVDGEVSALRRDGDGAFEVALADGRRTTARRLLLATGVVDELPDVPGVRQRWGHDVLHCPYCHGWEVRDQRIGVLATMPHALHQAHLFRQLSDRVVLLRHTLADLPGEQAARLAARGVDVVDGEVVALDVVDDRLRGVRLADGSRVALDALVVAAPVRVRADVAAGLDLATTDLELGGVVFGTTWAVDATGATSAPGVWAAGNAASPAAQVVSSAAAGLAAGAAINADLVEADVAAALAAAEGGRAEWEDRYRGTGPRTGAGAGTDGRIWSGEPNAVLVDVLTRPGAAAPSGGRVLDLGCGEGGDAVWLARQGWHVDAVDVSPTALDRARALARQEGVEERVTTSEVDLATSFPPGSWDLVAASFLHSTVEGFPRARVLRSAAAAVAPGGRLVVLGHASAPPWASQAVAHAHAHHLLPAPAEVLASLHLDPVGWEVELCEQREREVRGPEGQRAVIADAVVAVRRR